MASKNNPISSAELIRKYSKARVVETYSSKLNWHLKLRPLNAADVRESLVKKYCQ